jgi:hypothetical protein
MDFIDIAIIALRPVVGLLVIGLIVFFCLRGEEQPRTAEDDEEDYWFWAIK